jgi:hypothetical protein
MITPCKLIFTKRTTILFLKDLWGICGEFGGDSGEIGGYLEDLYLYLLFVYKVSSYCNDHLNHSSV